MPIRTRLARAPEVRALAAVLPDVAAAAVVDVEAVVVVAVALL